MLSIPRLRCITILKRARRERNPFHWPKCLEIQFISNRKRENFWFWIKNEINLTLQNTKKKKNKEENGKSFSVFSPPSSFRNMLKVFFYSHPFSNLFGIIIKCFWVYAVEWLVGYGFTSLLDSTRLDWKKSSSRKIYTF